MTKDLHSGLSDADLSRWTVAELREAMAEQLGYSSKTLSKCNKNELVGLADAWVIRQRKAEAVAVEQAAREHEAELQRDREDERFMAAKRALLDGLCKAREEETATVEKFRAEIARGTVWQIASALEWQTSGVFDVVEKLRFIEQLIGNLEIQVDADKMNMTAREFAKATRDDVDEAVRRLVESSEYEHRSTSQLANVHGESVMRAYQWYAKLARSIAKSWARVMDGSKDVEELKWVRAW